MERIWVLTITHRHGADVHVHRTEEGAHARLAAWAEDYWDELDDDAPPMPEDPKERVSIYFEHHPEEYYYLGFDEVGA